MEPQPTRNNEHPPEGINDLLPPHQRGLLWQPGNEQEVVVLFGMLLQQLPIPLIIDQVRTEFPDCLAFRSDTGEPIRIEFELFSSSFRSHGHDPSGCDLIVCWENDAPPGGGLEVLALAEVVREAWPELILNDRPKHPREVWTEVRFLEQLDQHADAFTQQVVRRLVAFAKAEALGPRFVTGSYAAFSIGDTTNQFCKVYAVGRIGFPFCRWSRREVLPEAMARLNAALNKPLLEPAHATGKPAWPIRDVLANEAHVDGLIEILRWLKKRD